MSTYNEKIFGRNTFVAIKNVIPQVRKNTFVILMISTMMVIVVFGSTIFKTMQKIMKDIYNENFQHILLWKII